MHLCNPSYLGGEEKKDQSRRPAMEKVRETLSERFF
jgi:hypothetical protein